MAVVGGLLVSQLLTLFITPVIYVYLERARNFFRDREAAAAGESAPSGLRDRHVTLPGE
jgi:hypothetical protein